MRAVARVFGVCGYQGGMVHRELYIGNGMVHRELHIRNSMVHRELYIRNVPETEDGSIEACADCDRWTKGNSPCIRQIMLQKAMQKD